ncbi:MAG: sigma-54-dependent transcriptional regulator [Bdellovibrionales bacterium]
MSMESRILIVDDDLELLESAESLLSKMYSVKATNTVENAKSILLQNDFDVAIIDLNFEGQDEDGLVLLDFINDRVSDVEVVVLSGDQVTTRVVSAMKRTLVDFIPKSGDYGNTLKFAVAKGLEKKRVRTAKSSEHNFLTNSPKMNALLRTAQKIAVSSGHFPVLITGETGTGKEVLAQYLAKILSKKLVAANMASIPRETAESELFGHVKGAFTGAVSNKPGLIEQAHGGIFFLDELGECTLAIQAKLLRVLQERELQPVGSVKPKKIETRFFAATNKDLDAMVEEKTFRLDLLQRLNTIILHIPALRERPEDIVLYANHFLSEFSAKKMITLTSSGMDALLAHTWRGNVRELRNAMERLVVFNDRGVIESEDVVRALDVPLNQTQLVKNSAPDLKRAEILGALELEQGNRTRAAARLGIHTVTLQRWLKKLGIGEVFESQPGRPSLFKNAESTASSEVDA